DGLSSHPGPRNPEGYSGAGIRDLEEVLRIHPKWFNSGHEFSGHTGAVNMAAMALAAGLCRHVLCFRCTWESTAQALAREAGAAPPLTVEGDNQWRFP